MNTVIAIGLIIGGSVIFQVVGMAWYGPLFGKTWMKSCGKKAADLKISAVESKIVYGGSFVAGLFTSGFLYLLAINPVANYSQLVIGIVGVTAFAAAASLPSYLFEKRSLTGWSIHFSYVVVTAVLVGSLMKWIV